METIDLWKFLIGSPPIAVAYLWVRSLEGALRDSRAEVKEERARNQALTDTIIKISADRVADANGRVKS